MSRIHRPDDNTIRLNSGPDKDGLASYITKILSIHPAIEDSFVPDELCFWNDPYDTVQYLLSLVGGEIRRQLLPSLFCPMPNHRHFGAPKIYRLAVVIESNEEYLKAFTRPVSRSMNYVALYIRQQFRKCRVGDVDIYVYERSARTVDLRGHTAAHLIWYPVPDQEPDNPLKRSSLLIRIWHPRTARDFFLSAGHVSILLEFVTGGT